jgi:long-chain acyl-CoA synthetase
MEEAKNMGFSDEDLKNIMEQNRNGLNEMLPAYEKITEIVIHEDEFEKTPKRSIKRYLYQ